MALTPTVKISKITPHRPTGPLPISAFLVVFEDSTLAVGQSDVEQIAAVEIVQEIAFRGSNHRASKPVFGLAERRRNRERHN